MGTGGVVVVTVQTPGLVLSAASAPVPSVSPSSLFNNLPADRKCQLRWRNNTNK